MDTYETGGCGIAMITVAVMVAIAVAYLIGFAAGVYVEEKRAFQAAVGRFAVDPKTGKTSFLYGCSHAR